MTDTIQGMIFFYAVKHTRNYENQKNFINFEKLKPKHSCYART